TNPSRPAARLDVGRIDDPDTGRQKVRRVKKAVAALFAMSIYGPRTADGARVTRRRNDRIRPPAFPTRSRPRLVGTAMEISRFPGRRLLRMPGSATARGRLVSCDDDTDHFAFCWTENISAPNLSYAAQYLAYALPCQRFACGLTTARA